MTSARADELYNTQVDRIASRTDRWFGYLLMVEYVACVIIAVVVSPRTWAGESNQVHLHVWTALLLGGMITALPVTLAYLCPGKPVTRFVIASAQMLYSALLIHLAGGRIETHFHVFGSLAFLAFYRDWRVFIPATLIVSIDHMARGIFWPESVYGVLTASPWRSLEHASWVIFEDIFLIRSCILASREMRSMAEVRADLESTNVSIEQRVVDRTIQLHKGQERLKQEIADRHRLEGQLVHAQKMESIGQLAAGIAHEINTPTQYVGDNTRFVRDSIDDLLLLVDQYGALLDAARLGVDAHGLIGAIDATIEKIDLEFVKAEIPRAIEQTLDGIDRVAEIVRAMKDFSHPGSGVKLPTDLNKAIESTITVCKNRWKYVSNLTTDYGPGLPAVPCLVGEFNQVILNIVVNAADAIGEIVGDSGASMGDIFVSTRLDGEHVEIRIRDTGGGVPEAIQKRIFDPFFTTKAVGKGTGQGLAISHDVIATKHGGTITLEVEPGVGTTFIIRMPIAEESAGAGLEAA
jgi:signal transduction histidine kinase